MTLDEIINIIESDKSINKTTQMSLLIIFKDLYEKITTLEQEITALNNTVYSNYYN